MFGCFFHAWFASESYITAKANWVLTTGQSDYKIIHHAPNWAVYSQPFFQCQANVSALDRMFHLHMFCSILHLICNMCHSAGPTITWMTRV